VPGDKPYAARECGVADAVEKAKRILDKIDERWPDPRVSSRDATHAIQGAPRERDWCLVLLTHPSFCAFLLKPDAPAWSLPMLQVVPAPPDPDGFQPSGLARLVLWLILVVISVFQFILLLPPRWSKALLKAAFPFLPEKLN